jgi:hypothetical protein
MTSASHGSMMGHKASCNSSEYGSVIAEICSLRWNGLSRDELINVAFAYYYFSTQFRENLEIALTLYPDDNGLKDLDTGERNTDNLSPWPGVAEPGEKMNHDEFMRRLLTLETIPELSRDALHSLGTSYLSDVRATDSMTKAMSLVSYEDGGFEARHADGTVLGWSAAWRIQALFG